MHMLEKASFFDVKRRQWNYLGVSFYNKDVENQKRVLIPIEPYHFRHFLLTGPNQLLDDIFSGDQLIPATYHINPDSETGDFDPNSEQTQVTLCFGYKYVVQKTKTAGEDFPVTPMNAKLIYKNPNYLAYDLETQLPTTAHVTLSPYTGQPRRHFPGVDMFFYYRWTGPDPDTGRMTLRIRIDQDPIPIFLEGVGVLPPTSSWCFLGAVPVTSVQKNLREFWFWDEGDEDYVQTFVRAFHWPGELRARFIGGYGVRAAYVTTPGIILHGLQLKKLTKTEDSSEMVQTIVKNESEYVCLSFGPDLLEFNPKFINPVIQVFHRWSGTAIELSIDMTDDDVEEQDGLMTKVEKIRKEDEEMARRELKGMCTETKKCIKKLK